MIVRKNLDWRVIVRVGWKRILLLATLSTAVYIAYSQLNTTHIAISTVPASILGVAIAFLIGFRVNSAYERWWEARKIWGALVNESRSFARQVMTLIGPGFSPDISHAGAMDIRRQLIYGHIGFVHALRAHLRRQDVLNEIKPWFDEETFLALGSARHIPNAIMLLQARRLESAFRNKATEDFRHMQIDSRMNAITDAMGACERIKNTVFPRQYSYYSTKFTLLYSLLLPFILVQEAGALVIPFTVLIGFIFFALDGIAAGIENPFENSFNDVPISSISLSIESNLLEMLGESNLPAPAEPVNGFLF